MTEHWEEPPDPIPDEWTLRREAILFEMAKMEEFTPQDLRDVADDLPAAFNTQSVYGDHGLVGYAHDHGDYNEAHPENPLNANVDPTHGVWNGIFNGLAAAGYDIQSWWKMERYETGEMIDHPILDEPIPEVRDYLFELDPPPSASP